MELHTCLEKEQFSTLNHTYSYDYSSDSTNMDTLQNFSSDNPYEWDMDHEQELNGDLALIPEISDNTRDSMNKIIDSPPTVDLHRLMNELQDLISIDPVHMLPIEENLICPLPETNYSLLQQKSMIMDDVLSIPNSAEFDLTKYLTEEEPKPNDLSVQERKPRAGVKKIDLKAQKYIVDAESDSEEENHSEITSTPALEAGDLYSLLEQFEASELPDFPAAFMEDNANVDVKCEPVAIKKEQMDCIIAERKLEMAKVEQINDVKVEMEEQIKSEPSICLKKEIKMEPITKEEESTPHKQCRETPHHPIKTETETPLLSLPILENPKPEIACDNLHVQVPPQETVAQTAAVLPNQSQDATTQVQNRKVLTELPQDLISRLKENRKRKAIAVIPPIPTKKRGGPKVQEPVPQVVTSKGVKTEPVFTVHLDHDYCTKICPELAKKEQQSFSSADEDERAVIGKQPMVKNADGKLMVSLLKVNTIHGNDAGQKKKLDIEEYKKRREGKMKLQGSQNNSASSSSCSSPVPEDENTRIQKHQEKLMRMAMEVLNTRPKSEKKQQTALVQVAPTQLQIPFDMEKKTFVSIGVNTEFKICKNLDPVTPVQRLEEMKPLLEKASDKFNCNSLITSLIENIPKVINNTLGIAAEKTPANGEHGEDKTIVYLPKNRVPTKTNTVEVQTNISLIQQTKEGRYRRRRDSSSSSSSSSVSRNSRRSSHHSRRRKDSDCSCTSSRSSKSSYYRSRSNSRSRSRSRSPPPLSSRYSNWEKERVREVEERRVVYVGRISSSTTREDLRERFSKFGPITNISLHFRDHGYLDNYGFVTFANQYDAFEAIEHANDDPYHPKYDLSFGGRRQFCMTAYSDLDNMRDDSSYYPPSSAQDSFDTLLREAQEKLRRRKF